MKTAASPQPEPAEVAEEAKAEDCHILSQEEADPPKEPLAQRNLVNMALLFIAAVLYSGAVGGAVQMLGVFVVKEPLSWTATEVTVCTFSMYISPSESCLSSYEA